MLSVLLVKTSSLGDIVHNLPVASDIRARFPEARIDWAVEEAYVPLVHMHPAVGRVIPVAIRRWRSRALGRATWGEIQALRRTFRAAHYDAIIDTQGLIKSALLARAAQGRRHGPSASCAREPLAARFYDVVHHVARGQHAVVRNRTLAAASLGFRAGSAVDYGILRPVAGRGVDAVLLHSASRAAKLWPEERWGELARALEARGLRCVLPWLGESERVRSEAIGRGVAHAWIPQNPLSLEEITGRLAAARVVVGVDTGLVHLAAALGAPVVAIFCATDPALTGVYGARRARNLGGPGEPPAVAQVLDALAEFDVAAR